MLSTDRIRSQLPHTLEEIQAPLLGKKIAGKVRDSFIRGDKRVLVTSDRLSAFDRVLTSIPFKGQVLNAMALHWFEKTKHILNNHILSAPHPNVLIARQIEILPIEIVVRGYLAGSAWRDYQAGNTISGVTLPPGLHKSQKLPAPILTPSTKAEIGAHDQPISEDEILAQGIIPEALWSEISEKAFALFDFGSEEAAKQGLILVDTKYEMGLQVEADGKTTLVLADEVHTPDSSRYWIASSYQERMNQEQDPEMLDKEFVRRWLLERGYMGEGTPPEFDDDFRIEIARRYIEVCELMTGREFEGTIGPVRPAVEALLNTLSASNEI